MIKKTIRNVELSLSIQGEGKTFIWAHGLTSSRAFEDEIGLFNWNSLDSVVKLVRYDARGHGKSCSTFDISDYKWNNLASDMIELIRDIDELPVVAGGTSMGCATALYTALMEPARIKALVLANPPAAWEARVQQTKLFTERAEVIEKEGFSGLLSLIEKKPPSRIFAQEFPEYRNIFIKHLGKINIKALPYIYRGIAGSDFPSQEIFKPLRIPTIILAWQDDEGHPVTIAERLCDLIKGSVLHISNNLSDIYKWPIIVRNFIDQI